MPEANILYTVTAVIVAGLVVWVLAALKTAKTPWARPEAAAALAAASKMRDADVPVEKVESSEKADKVETTDAKSEDATAVKPATDAETETAEDAEEEKKKEEA